MDGDFDLLRKIVVKGGNVATYDECGADEYEVGVREEEGGPSESEGFK